MNLNDYRGVFVFAEQRNGKIENVALELIGKATQLATTLEEKVTAILLGDNVSALATELVENGADRVLVVDKPELKNYDTEAYTQAISAIITEYKPEVLLIGATTIGRDLGPRISGRVETGLTADCTSLEVGENRELLMTRPAFGGNLMATIICPDHRPQMSTVRPGVMARLDTVVGRKGEIVNFAIDFDKSKFRVKLLEIVKEGGKKVDITEAGVLISGGRGLGNKDNFDKLQDLATEVKGLVSASRAATDAGWIAHDRQVGQTGKTVRPGVYFAMGISGAIQHVSGMEESEYIIAINRDKDAPIFGTADLGIVGDVNKIVPAIVEELKKSKLTK
ncbi:MAG: electron transfer flavoprotein subunit alpha/FixB family protein [Fusobacteriaceae bacterium]